MEKLKFEVRVYERRSGGYWNSAAARGTACRWEALAAGQQLAAELGVPVSGSARRSAIDALAGELAEKKLAKVCTRCEHRAARRTTRPTATPPRWSS